jgi:hypothetical protein
MSERKFTGLAKRPKKVEQEMNPSPMKSKKERLIQNSEQDERLDGWALQFRRDVRKRRIKGRPEVDYEMERG